MRARIKYWLLTIIVLLAILGAHIGNLSVTNSPDQTFKAPFLPRETEAGINLFVWNAIDGHTDHET